MERKLQYLGIALLSSVMLIGCDGNKTADTVEDESLERIWVHDTLFKPKVVSTSDTFGSSVDYDNDRLIVGIPLEDSEQLTIVNDDNVPTDNNDPDSGAAYVYLKSGDEWVIEAFLKAPIAADQFGRDVAIEGNIAAVTSSSHVFMFHRNNGQWQHEATFASEQTGGDASYGSQVLVFGDRVAVSAHESKAIGSGITTGYPGDGTDANGAVYIYKRTAGAWTLSALLQNPVENSNFGDNQFGYSIDFYGDTLVAGAPRVHTKGPGVFLTEEVADQIPENPTSYLPTGAVYTYVLNNDSWTHDKMIVSSPVTIYPETDVVTGVKISGTGTGVAIDEDVIAIAGSRDFFDTNTVTNYASLGQVDVRDNIEAIGSVVLYEKRDDTWEPTTHFRAPNSFKGNLFGDALDIIDNTLIVGSPGEAGSTTQVLNGDGVAFNTRNWPSSGAAYVYQKNDGLWRSVAYLKAPTAREGAKFGGDLVLVDSENVIIGHHGESTSILGLVKSRNPNPDELSPFSDRSGAVSLFNVIPNPNRDVIPPETSISAQAGTYQSANMPASTTIICTDAGENKQGCANTYYTVDGTVPVANQGTTALYNNQDVAISSSTATTIRAYSVDNQGNRENVKTFTFTPDNDAPTFSSSVSSLGTGSTKAIELSCEDVLGECEIYYTTDGTAPSSSSTLYTTEILVTESTTVRFVAIDSAGNVSAIDSLAITFATDADLTVQAVAGEVMMATLQRDGSVKVWGGNAYGTSGHAPGTNGDVDDSTNFIYYNATPTTIAGLSDVVQITAGGYHLVALQSDGTVKTWGRNEYAELGHARGSSGDAEVNNDYGIFFGDRDFTTPALEYYNATPVQVAGVSDVKMISAGLHHTLALTGTGTVYSWGSNDFGQLGFGTDGTIEESAALVKDPSGTGTLSNIAYIEAGDGQSYAVATDGTLYVWGLNSNGQLGLNDTTDRNLPVVSGTLSNVVSAKAGAQNGMALTVGQAVYTWGENFAGQLGNGSTSGSAPTPTLIAENGYEEIEMGGGSLFVIDADGTSKSWGLNPLAQLGVGTSSVTSSATPLTVGESEFVGISSASQSAIGIDINGKVFAWGQNDRAQLAHAPGTNGDVGTPGSGDIYNISGVQIEQSNAYGIAAPVGLDAVGGTGSATVTWTNVTGATSYNLYHSQYSGVNVLNGEKVTGVTNGGSVTLSAGNYYVVVTAVSDSGAESVASVEVYVTIN